MMNRVAVGTASAPDCRFGLGLFSLAVSLALHGWLATGLLSESRREPPPKREQLLVQFVGMVSKRQIEQKQPGDDSARSVPKALASVPQEIAKKVMAPRPPARKAPIPVKVRVPPGKTETRPRPEQQPQPVQQAEQQAEQQGVGFTPPASEQTMSTGESHQMQQTLKSRETEMSLIRTYLASLKQAIQNHLEYPREALDVGYVGAPAIRFTITESGDILPGSLAIHKSSGSAMLDEKALQAARGAAPMAKPPRQMAVTITVAFTQGG